MQKDEEVHQVDSTDEIHPEGCSVARKIEFERDQFEFERDQFEFKREDGWVQKRTTDQCSRTVRHKRIQMSARQPQGFFDRVVKVRKRKIETNHNFADDLHGRFCALR